MAHFRTASILTGVASFVCLVLLFANVAFGAFAVVGAFLTFVLYHGSGITEELAQRRRALAHAVEEHEQSIRLWQAAVVEPAMAIRIAMTEVEELRDRYCDLPRKYQEDKSMLENQGRERQLQHFLAGKIIASAKIPGIGSSLVGTLRSFGIETAADINYHTVRRAPGIGSSRARALVEWRQAVEGRFRFDPKKGVDRSDIDKLDRTYWRQRNEIERGLNERALRIRELSQRAIAQHGTLAETCIQAAHARAQAEADVAV
jgi:DNA-binding helix-hairpin-helix protein with protein kinase domain